LKKTLEDGKTSPGSWIDRINIVKKAMILKAIYRFNAVPINITKSFTKMKK
jgi:hypothetical protein